MTTAHDEAPKIVDLPIGLDATGMRKEFDSLGDVEVPANHYWGAQTQRTLQHFNIGHDKMPVEVYHAYGYVKKAAAVVNTAAGRLLRFSPGFWAFTFSYSAAALMPCCGSLTPGCLARRATPSPWSR